MNLHACFRAQGSLPANLLPHPQSCCPVRPVIEPLEARIAPATFTWDAGGGADTNWFNPLNWDQNNGFPTSGDTAILGINATIDLSATDVTVESFQQSTGTLLGDKALTVTSSLVWSGGAESGTGVTTLAGGTGSLSGTVALNGRTLNNAGMIVESGRLDFSGSGRLNNLAAGVYEIATSAGGTVFSGAASVPGFFNAGTMRHTLAVTSSVSVPFTNLAGGIIDATQGTLSFPLGGTWEGADFRIASGANVHFKSGNVALSGNYTGSGGGSLEFSGGTHGASAGVAFSGNFTANFPDGFFRFGDNASFSGGTIVNNGVMTIEGRPDLNGTIDNAGTIKHSASIDFGGAGRINNLAGGVYEVQSGSGGSIANGANPLGFFNAGTFRYNGAGDVVGVPFHSLAGGVIEADSGFVNFNTDGAWGNTHFVIAAGAEVRLNAGTKTWTGAFTGSGGGILRLGGGTQGASEGGFLTPGANGATVDFPAGFFHFSGNATINPGGVLTNVGEITITNQPDLIGTIDNAGVVRNLGHLDVGAGGRFNNLPGGTFELARVGGGTIASGADTVPGFFNSGTIRLTEAGTHAISVPWSNLTGTIIDVAAGTLAFHSKGSWEGANIQIATGSVVTLNSGDKVWTGTFAGTGGGVLRLGGGTQGASAGGRITVGTGGAIINFPNGGFEFSGNASLDGETLTNAGTLTFAARPNLGLIISNTGTMINQGQIDFSATGRINNELGGVFEIAKVAGGGFTAGGSSVPGIFNAGTLLLAINADVDSGVPFSNTGLVNVTGGTLRFPGAVFTQTAGSTRLAGGTLGGGTLNFAGGELTGVGPINGNVSNTGATVRPGGTGAIGTLSVTGNYTQGAGGALAFEASGTGAAQFDLLSVSGTAALGGTLGAALLNGFTPGASDVFNVVVAATRSGTFATLNAPASLALDYTATQAQLVAAAAPPALSINDVSVVESASGTVMVSFTISLSAPSSQPVTVQYATVDGTATAPEDYSAVALATVTFAPGEIIKTASVAVSGDTLAEPLEVFSVNLSNPTNATLLDPIGQGTIIEIAISDAGKSATFTDVDGDRIIVGVSKGELSAATFVLGVDGTLQKIDLTQGNFSGANITARAQQRGGGDGLVNIGAIDATGLKLGKVRVTGDLGQIDVGDGSGKALKALTVGSLGALGATTQPAGVLNPLLSEIRGSLPILAVQRDVKDAIVEVSDKLGKVRIGGSLIDSGAPSPTGLRAGSIGVFLNGGIPPVTASRAGTIFAPNIGQVTVAGDINGGEITAEEEIKSVKIVGRLMSLNPLDPAVLRAGTAIDKIVINDDVQNALILAGYNRALQPRNPDASIGKVVVNGDWTASSVVAGVADPTDNGFGLDDTLIGGDATPSLLSRIASVIVKGTANGSATPTDHSAITAQKIGQVRIADVKASLTNDPDNVLLDPLNQNFRAVEI